MANILPMETIEYIGIPCKAGIVPSGKRTGKKADMGRMLEYVDKLK